MRVDELCRRVLPIAAFIFKEWKTYSTICNIPTGIYSFAGLKISLIFAA